MSAKILFDENPNNLDPEHKPEISLGNKVPVEITWHNKPSGIGGLIDFYIHTATVVIGKHKVNIVENNCYSRTFGAHLLSPRKGSNFITNCILICSEAIQIHNFGSEFQKSEI